MEILLKKMMFQMDQVYAQIKSKKLYNPEEEDSGIFKALKTQLEGFNKDANSENYFSEKRNLRFFSSINMQEVRVEEDCRGI